MEGYNPGRNQPYILDVSVETIDLKKRKSSTVHENSQPKVAKIPVTIKFVKKKVQVKSNIEESTDNNKKALKLTENCEDVSNEAEVSSVTDTDISRPNLSYPELISEALLNSSDGMLIYSDILKSISARYPCYQMTVSGWQISITNELNHEKKFIKCTERRGSYYYKLSEKNCSPTNQCFKCLDCNDLKNLRSEYVRISKDSLEKSVQNNENKELMSEEKKSSSSRKSKIVSNVKTLRKIASKGSVSDSRSKLQCNICEKTFESSDDVENHVKSDHAQLNPKQCSLCDMYLSERAFDVHVALVHEGKKWTELYKCSFKNCKVKFVTKSALTEHFYSAHKLTGCGWKKLHMCRICDRTFKLEYLLKVA